MFGHDSLPTKNYKYGCVTPKGEAGTLIREQIRLAHKYRLSSCTTRERRIGICRHGVQQYLRARVDLDTILEFAR